MPRLKVLTGIWLAAAVASWIGIMAGQEKHSREDPGRTFQCFVLAVFLAGAINGYLYGLCLRALHRGTRYFCLVSVYPVLLPNLPLLTVAGLFAWGALTASGKQEWFLAATLAILVPASCLTAAGWRLRRPRLYLAALAAAGVPATLIGAGLARALLTLPVQQGIGGLGTAILLIFSCMVSAIALWYAVAAAAGAWMMGGPGAHSRTREEA